MTTLPPALVGGSHYALYDNYYQQIDTSNRGTIGALEAATFLKKSGLSDITLSKIWDIADANGKGYLTKSGFFTALKLVSLVQAGYDVSTNNLTIDVPPPNMGIQVTSSSSQSPSNVLPNSINKIPPTVPPVPLTRSPALPVHSTSDWAMKQEEKIKYDKLFDSLQPSNGVIPGNKVKGMLMDSKLSIDILSKIWDLADMDKDGALNRHEFCVAMHLVYKALEKYAIPSCLPPELLPPERRKDSSSFPGAVPVLPVIPNGVSRCVTPEIVRAPTLPPAPLIPSPPTAVLNSTPLITMSSLVSSTTLYSTTPLIPIRTSSPTISLVPHSSANIISTTSSSALYNTTQFTATAAAASFAQHIPTSSQDDDLFSSVPWVISAQDKVKYDILFNQADLDKDGYVSGHEIKNVFLQSGVAQPVLAHIWSLCDTAEEGKLNNEQFALALWLISRKLKGIDPPSSLTPEMVPPSCRKTYSLPNDNFVPISDPEIDELSRNVQKLLEERTTIETEIENRKDDIKVKMDEVESLQGELNALVATLKQLEMQKQEAQKRLNDLQKQTDEMQSELDNLSKQIDIQRQQVDKLKQQASQQEEVIKAREEELTNKKKQLGELNKQEENANKRCAELEQEIRNTVKICDDYKQQQEEANNKISALNDFKTHLENAISNLEMVIDANDISVLVESNLHVEPKFRDPVFSIVDPEADVTDGVKEADENASQGNSKNVISNSEFTNAFQNDPFTARGTVDSNKPVGTPDPFASEKMFDANFDSKKTDLNEDPFAPTGINKKGPPFSDEEKRNPTMSAGNQQQQSEQDPFGCDPFAILHAPPKISNSNATTPSPRSESPSPALPPKKSKQPPPRPAPPKPAAPSLHQTDSGGFDSDFADFSKIPLTPFNASNSRLTIKQQTPPATSKDPFRDYRYEDPFSIEEDYNKMTTTTSLAISSADCRRSSSAQLQQQKSSLFFDSDDPFSSNSSNNSSSCKPFNGTLSKSTPVSPLPSEDQQLAWATAESVRLEKLRQKHSVQEEANIKLALKLSKSESKRKKNSLRSKILS